MTFADRVRRLFFCTSEISGFVHVPHHVGDDGSGDEPLAVYRQFVVGAGDTNPLMLSQGVLFGWLWGPRLRLLSPSSPSSRYLSLHR